MATTPPDKVRAALAVVAAEAVAEVKTVTAATDSAEELRSALFLAAPLIVGDYTDGASALALDWYEELREAASPRRLFTPKPVRLVTDDAVRAIVGSTTQALADAPNATPLSPGTAAALALAAPPDTPVDPISVSLELFDGRIVELVADAFRDTIVQNTVADPNAAGWRRFARPGACRFCRMLADKGAVYTERTARFAAHGATMAGGRKGGNCMCLAGPEFGSPDTWTEASPMQYVASKRKRTAAEKARLRDYLNEHYPSGGDPAKRKKPTTPAAPRTPKTPDAASADDFYAGRTLPELRKTLAELEASEAVWSNDFTREVLAKVRREIAKRTKA